MDFTGKVHKIFPIQEFKNNFTKREFVIADETGQFPQYITFQLLKDRCSLIEKFNEGDIVKVAFNLNGREWVNPEGKSVYFNSLVAWKIDPAEGGSSRQDANEPPDEFTANSDDMPF
jgi:hypothetical protein